VVEESIEFAFVQINGQLPERRMTKIAKNKTAISGPELRWIDARLVVEQAAERTRVFQNPLVLACRRLPVSWIVTVLLLSQAGPSL